MSTEKSPRVKVDNVKFKTLLKNHFSYIPRENFPQRKLIEIINFNLSIAQFKRERRDLQNTNVFSFIKNISKLPLVKVYAVKFKTLREFT